MWTCEDGVCVYVNGSLPADLTCAAPGFKTPCAKMIVGGLVFAVGSALANGAFAVPYKLTARRGSKAALLHPHVFNFWACVGIVLTTVPVTAVVGLRVSQGSRHCRGGPAASCRLARSSDARARPADLAPMHAVAIYAPPPPPPGGAPAQCTTPAGLISGALFVASTACTFGAIQQLGLSLASGIW